MDLKDDGSPCENESFAPEYRDRLRTWLEKMINSGSIPGLCWENKERTIFRMPWKHAGRQDYNLEEDSKIFMAWAIHSGRYREGIDKPEPIVWKTRLRCALNKMPDIRELPERSRLDISEPYRVYQLLPPVHKASQIRRRLYKRSPSQETELNHTRAISLSSSPKKEETDWDNELNARRRNSSVEAPHLGVQKPQCLSLTSMSTAGASPRFWIPPSVTLPLKSPMSSSISNGMHVPQSLAIDPTNPLQSLAHQRYPLMPSLQNPFAAAFPGSTIPFFPTTASLETFKRFGFGDHPLYRQKYQEHLSNFARKLKESNQPTHDRNRIHSNDTSPEQQSLNKHKYKSDDSPFEYRLKNKTSESNARSTNSSNRAYQLPSDEHAVLLQLNECQQKIESLESELEKSRSAHAREKKARKELEEEREVMKMTLERMGDSLRALAVHIHPREEKILENFRQNLLRENETETSKKLNNGDDLKTISNSGRDTSSPRSLSTSPTQRNTYRLSVGPSKISKTIERQVSDGIVQEQKMLKRTSSPLDLTVHSPGKKPRLSVEEDINRSSHSAKSSLAYVDSSFSSSFNERDVSEEKRAAASPSSLCSASPDNVTPSGEGESRSNFVNHSPSPLRHSAGILHSYPQCHGTIQVT